MSCDANVDPLAADVAQQWKENEANAIATGTFRVV
jgi:hypothetical protein